MRLQDRVAIITGSASGLGRAMAERLAEEGARIVIADKAEDGVRAVVAALTERGWLAEGHYLDVTNREQWGQVVNETSNRWGRIDILVNNAGISRNRHFLEMNDSHWDPVLAVDLKGVFYGAQAVATSMISRHYGKIVNIASIAGTGTAPHATSGSQAGSANYAAAKAGVIQLTKTLARELSPHGINVNCVAPGFVLTPLTYTSRTVAEVEEHIAVRRKAALLNRVGLPEDVANAVLFFCTDEASFITAQTLCVDGGRHDRI